MKPENKRKYREFLEDPAGELPAGLRAELSADELREAGRHGELDRNLRRVLGELGAAADKRAPALSEKQFKENLLQAISSSASDSAADELAYLRKMRNRDLTKRLVNRPAYSLGAVAALLAIAFLPFVYQSQNPGHSDSVAMSEVSGPANGDVADDEQGMRLGAPAPADTVNPGKKNDAPARRVPAYKPAAPAQPNSPPAEGDLAMGRTEAERKRAQKVEQAPAAEVEEEVAMLSRGMPPAPGESPAGAKAKAKPEAVAPASVPLDVKLRVREKMLTQKVKMARDKDAKRKALRNLEAFYKKHRQAAKQKSVERQLQQLQ